MAVEATAFLGGSVTVVHAYKNRDLPLSRYWHDMLATFRELGDYAAGKNVRLGIETGFPNTINDYLRLVQEIDHDSVGATLDVGHLVGYFDRKELVSDPNRVYNNALLEISESLGECHKLFHIHLHDVRKEDLRDHRAMGSGIIDFPRFFKALSEVDYDGLLMFEFEEPNRIETLAEAKRFVENHLN